MPKAPSQTKAKPRREPLPHLQFLIIAIMGPKKMSGRDIREAMRAQGAHKTKAAAYQLFARMVDAGLLEGDWEEWLEDGETYRRKVFRVTGEGHLASDRTRDFYQQPLVAFAGGTVHSGWEARP